jgi:hypothetical protein
MYGVCVSKLTIAKTAREAGVNLETIRFYQRKGLLPTPPRTTGSIRHYGASDVARIRFIKAAQRWSPHGEGRNKSAVSSRIPRKVTYVA